jgi:AraC-like DNA-binding protein
VTTEPKIPTVAALSGSARVGVWSVTCCAGPHDPSYPECHRHACVALVRDGYFTYTESGRAHLMGPGSLLLGRTGRDFECSHEYTTGDVCTSFDMAPELLDEVFAAQGLDWARDGFPAASLPPLPRATAIVRGFLSEGAPTFAGVDADEAAYLLAQTVATALADGSTTPGVAAPRPSARDRDRVQSAIERIEHEASVDTSSVAPTALADLAADAGVSAFHFLRLFRAVSGVTPHQYVIRSRLNRAVALLLDTAAPVTTVAYDSGFEDLSNFVRTFRRVVGCTPGALRAARRR